MCETEEAEKREGAPKRRRKALLQALGMSAIPAAGSQPIAVASGEGESGAGAEASASAMLEALFKEEIRRTFRAEIERIAMEFEGGGAVNINLYGIEEEALREIVRASCGLAGVKIKAGWGRLRALRREGVYVLDVKTKDSLTVRREMYRLLEKCSKGDASIIFLITSLKAVDKIEKRVKSRMFGPQIYVGKMPVDSYKRIFAEFARGRKRQVGISISGSKPGRELDEEAARAIELGYAVDNTFQGMRELFCRMVYRLAPRTSYEMLNPVHAIILILSVQKKIASSSLHSEFTKMVQNVKLLKRTGRDVVVRRYHDLLDLEMIQGGVFVGDRGELEEFIAQRREVYLRVILQRSKKHWK